MIAARRTDAIPGTTANNLPLRQRHAAIRRKAYQHPTRMTSVGAIGSGQARPCYTRGTPGGEPGMAQGPGSGAMGVGMDSSAAGGRLRLFTIGFTQKNAEQFFSALLDAGVRRVVDVRLNNTSQLAAFTKRTDLPYFLRQIGGIDYIHLPDLAPSRAIFDAITKRGGDWRTYEREFLALLDERRVAETIAPTLADGDCLLCSEATPERCHRRLVAEYFRRKLGGVDVVHL